MGEPIIELERVTKTYGQGDAEVRGAAGIDLDDRRRRLRGGDGPVAARASRRR